MLSGDGEELSVSLVVDIEPAISCLGTHVLPANFEQEASHAPLLTSSNV